MTTGQDGSRAHPLRLILEEGARALGLNLTPLQVDLLLDYMTLIQKWNKVYNLTAVRDPADMLTHHLLDSLAAVQPLRRQTGGRPVKLLDVGAGAGLPGVVVAICCPDVRVTCVDTVAKKAAFISQVALTLKLPNLRGLHARVESLSDGFDVVCSRAFASLLDFTAWSRSALRRAGVDDEHPSGIWMALKGKLPADEIAVLPLDLDVFHVEQITVPGLDAERCIVWLRMKS
jgi:16S rRNA (guanine527-N7)-methyltransferase